MAVSHHLSGPICRVSASHCPVAWLLFLLCWLAIHASFASENPPLSPRSPLIDAAIRAEADSYARIDEMARRSSMLPEVLDPEIYSAPGNTDDLRHRLLQHVLWLQTQEAAHLHMIESLPAHFASISTDEPYQRQFVRLYEDAGMERYRRVQDIYQSEIRIVEELITFVDLVANDVVKPSAGGFSFRSEKDAADYRNRIATLNRSYEEQDQRVADYYTWEIGQKAQWRAFRDQL